MILEDDDDGSAIKEDDIERIEEGIKINEDADEDNNPPRLIVECPPIPTVKPPHPVQAMNREERQVNTWLISIIYLLTKITSEEH